MNIFEQLKRPFPEDKIHWRVGNTNAKKLGCKPWEATEGSALAYVDARDVMQRLDEVMGPAGWQCRYPLSDSGLLICEVGLNVAQIITAKATPIGELTDTLLKVEDNWIWKANGAGDTQVEAEKGKCSDAFKRAAVLWGIGRYLYYLPFSWVDLQNGRLKYNPPLPKWATQNGWDMLTQAKAAREAGHPKMVADREPQEPATKEQIAALKEWQEKFEQDLPTSIREVNQIKSYLAEDLTQPNAAEILHKLNLNNGE
jgi:hypothetical protein